MKGLKFNTVQTPVLAEREIYVFFKRKGKMEHPTPQVEGLKFCADPDGDNEIEIATINWGDRLPVAWVYAADLLAAIEYPTDDSELVERAKYFAWAWWTD